MLIQIVIFLLVVGALLYLLRLIPIDERVKTAITVVVLVAGAIWLLQNLGVLMSL